VSVPLAEAAVCQMEDSGTAPRPAAMREQRRQGSALRIYRLHHSSSMTFETVNIYSPAHASS
jgi:hypothetical protein